MNCSTDLRVFLCRRASRASTYRGCVIGIGALSALLVPCAAHAQDVALADLSLEELAEMPVISVSKAARPVSDAPASVFVITHDDVRRNGATTLPEALRLAPNLQVARIDARNYAISARGFNNLLANKMLVMIDGRTVYSPFFSGVFWDAQDVLLEDLDRVEVVSGPGGTLWGANAVNGVINVVTRSAAETQGELFSVGASEQEHHAAARYGGELIADGHYRVYGKRSQHDDVERADGSPTETGWDRSQAGFRTDWTSNNRSLTVQGDFYQGELEQTDLRDTEIEGANVLTRATWARSAESLWSLQAYFDHTHRDQAESYEQHLNTIDIELQHEWSLDDTHTLVWGGGHRYLTDRVENRQRFEFLPDDVVLRWTNVFAQDEITLTDKLRLTVGTRLEHNPYTGWESMPSAHLAWTPAARQLIWSSIAIAVRSPSRIDRDFFSPVNPPLLDGVPQYEFAGGKNFESETSTVYELGYRSQPVAAVNWSVTGFYSHYDDLRTLEPNPSGTGQVFRNRAKGNVYGLETWASWQATARWRLHAGFVVQRLDIDLKPGSLDTSSTTNIANGDPEFYGQIRSAFDISHQLTLDAFLRHAGEIEQIDVPAYTSLDLRLGWRPLSRLELSLVGQNLLDDTHPEFGRAPVRSEFERGVFGKLVWGL